MLNVKCPDCFGDGVETCHNPDHGFLSGMGNVFLNANESACPCCGHDPEHKMKGVCDTCNGSGQVTEEIFHFYISDCLNSDISEDELKELKEYCYGEK